MKKVLLFVCFLININISTHAQQLYFIRAIVEPYFDFYKKPPVQIISYKPERDTVLQVYQDYTNMITPTKYINLKSVAYYPQFKMFCFINTEKKSYALNTRKKSLIELTTECPPKYTVSPFLSMNIINGHWAYECNNDAASDDDYSIFKGMDFDMKTRLDLKASDFKDLYLTGKVSQYVVLKPNDSNIYLPIVADTAKRPVFSVKLPPEYYVKKKTFTRIAVNDELLTLLSTKWVNPQNNEDYGACYAALYHKPENKWFDVEFKGNAPVIMTYGHWLAGMVQDSYDGKRYFPNKTSPGRAVRDSLYMRYENILKEWTFDEWMHGRYRPGILFLLNVDTQKYIEWSTNQGDSEILLVQDEIVYYRVFDEIYKAQIVDGARLGASELLVRDRFVVPFIHWAYISSN
jgi:hypothetical protein